jgi:LemA protein
MAMSKKLIIGVVAVVIVIAMLLMIVLPYNSIVSKEQDVKAKWSNIKVELERKYQLLPQVLAAVNTSMGFEQSMLTNLTTLRTQWLNELASNNVQGVGNATTALDVQVGAFLSVAENYPDVMSITVIQDFIVTIEGSENRIASARIFYNDAVNGYNTAIRSFPNNMIAGSFGFSQATYFQE